MDLGNLVLFAVFLTAVTIILGAREYSWNELTMFAAFALGAVLIGAIPFPFGKSDVISALGLQGNISTYRVFLISFGYALAANVVFRAVVRILCSAWRNARHRKSTLPNHN